MKGDNPFSPDFGTPLHFFGRQDLIDMMRDALKPGRQPNRSVLVEGVRGMGKTALLGRFRQLAEESGWEVAYEISGPDPSELARDVAATGRHRPRTFSLNASTPIGGGGLSFSFDPEDTSSFRRALIDHLRKSGKGMLILLDEAQKLSERYAQEVCIALNAAREEGLDVALVIAGLPGTYRRISEFDRCTFMARSTRIVLPPLRASVTIAAFASSFALVPEMSVDEGAVETMARWTCGHPYLIQLVGYDLYRQVANVVSSELDAQPHKPVKVTGGMIDDAEEFAWRRYANDVLRLIFSRYRNGTMEYLQALASTADAEGTMASGGAIARMMGKERAEEVNTYRKRLIDAGILKADGYGRLRFAIPFVRRYLEEQEPSVTAPDDDDDYFPVQ